MNQVSDMYEWVVRKEISEDKALLKLKVKPFDGMVVIIGRIDFIDAENFRFQYIVIDNPKQVDYKENIEFHKYLERIVDELLRVKRNELEKQSANDS